MDPILNGCVPLLAVWKGRLPVVEAVLELFRAITRQMAIYLENRAYSSRLYSCLLALLRTYTENQLGRFHGDALRDLQEENAADLVLVMEVLTNIMSKDVLITAATEEQGRLLLAKRIRLFQSHL